MNLKSRGLSSDDKETNCQVYADINDISPMQKVMAVGSGGDGGNDFSKWTFTYTKEYQLIMKGENELTAKISCFDDANSSSSNINARTTTIPISKWHTINVTAAFGGEDGEKDEGEREDSNASQLTSLPILMRISLRDLVQI